MPLMPSSASLEVLGDNMSRQSLLYLCQSLAQDLCKNSFLLCSGSSSYQSVPTLSDLGPKGMPQSPSCWASGLAAHHAGLTDLVWYIWESWVTELRNANNFSTYLFRKMPCCLQSQAQYLQFHHGSVGSSASYSAHSFVQDISLRDTRAPEVTARMDIQRQAGTLSVVQLGFSGARIQGSWEPFLCWSQWSRTGSLLSWQGWKMFILSLSPSHTNFLFFIE